MGFKPRQFAMLVIIAVLTAGCAVRHSFEIGGAAGASRPAASHPHSGEPECAPAPQAGHYERKLVETVGERLPDGSTSTTKVLVVDGDLGFGLAADRALRAPGSPLMRVTPTLPHPYAGRPRNPDGSR